MSDGTKAEEEKKKTGLFRTLSFLKEHRKKKQKRRQSAKFGLNGGLYVFSVRCDSFKSSNQISSVLWNVYKCVVFKHRTPILLHTKL